MFLCFHVNIIIGKPPFIDVPEDEYPVVVKQRVGTTERTVLIVQAAAYTKYIY